MDTQCQQLPLQLQHRTTDMAMALHARGECDELDFKTTTDPEVVPCYGILNCWFIFLYSEFLL